MSEVEWEYQKPWRPSAGLLWAIALVSWIIGGLAEKTIPGAISASGGLAIAFTTPLFGIALSKQQAFELDLKLTQLQQTREAELGKAVVEDLASEQAIEVQKKIKIACNNASKNKQELRTHKRFTKSIVYAQSWIVGLSSALWSLGDWIGNLFIHCGSLRC